MKILIKYIFSFKMILKNMIYFTKKRSKELNKRKTKKKDIWDPLYFSCLLRRVMIKSCS